MKNSGGTPKSNWIFTLWTILKKDRERKKSNCLCSMLCCIVTCRGLIFCIFLKSCINSQLMFGAEFRLRADAGNNSSNKKLITFKTGLHGEPQTQTFQLSFEGNQLWPTVLSLLGRASTELSRLLRDLAAWFLHVGMLTRLDVPAAWELPSLCLLIWGQMCFCGLQSYVTSFKSQCTIYFHGWNAST